MSLSRILNDEPLPAHTNTRASYTTSSRAMPGDSHLAKQSPPSTSDQLSLTPYDHIRDSSQGYGQHEVEVGINTLQENRRHMSSEEAREPLQQGEDDAFPRKRRKGGKGEVEYHPPEQRRVSLRKNPSRKKPTHAQSLESEPSSVGAAHSRKGASNEELRLASSDLEDCEEIWIGELSEYMLETQKRQNQVADWFESSIVEHNTTIAQRISHHYTHKITKIPWPPTSSIHPHARMEIDFRDQSPFLERTNGHEHGKDHNSVRLRDHSRRFAPGAEDAALEFERSILEDSYDASEPQIVSRSKKGKEANKRVASDTNSDFDLPGHNEQSGPAHKKRKLLKIPSNSAEDDILSIGEVTITPPTVLKLSKGKGKVKQLQREASYEGPSVTPKPLRKKGPRKKLGLAPEIESELVASHPPSASGDAASSLSRPPSPTTTISTIVYELHEHIPLLKKAKKVDDNAMLKRVKVLEEAQRKVWTNIARRDISKVYKYHTLGYQSRQAQMERVAKVASLQARKPFTKTAKANKDTQAKAKRLMREMQVFWKKNEKEERDVRKREQKEASDRLKIEEEKREAARQARKLEFLISQTELYSHFVGSKLKTTEIEGDEEGLPVPAGVDVGEVDPATLADINFDDDDPINLRRHAKHNAQEAVALAKQRAQQFDTQAALERKTNEALKLAKAQAHIHDNGPERPSVDVPVGFVDLDSDELNFQNPTSLSGPLTIRQPKMLMAQLKEYQLKGLNWLATLYEQGINGILADEMGLGKTVQSISLLAYLAETHDIWGPFLVVAPASTLHNWQQEITRFVPGLKALPYWGNVKDRATLRKFWSKKEISYDQDAPFHILITSYQLVTQDQQYFQRVKWQYMILDEAQNIKNSSSVRWKTLLGFHCRNRLLLTGTPIQNSMQELWALLHFIMPSLFDSHDEFNEWFSKDIENAAENKGSKLNERQLRRLHMILKPFMLRRVKRHVQNELSEKIEKDIYVDLSARQRALYKALHANVSVADLLEKAANIGDADSARSLMNLVMQFRKVCNHPELFERADVVAPFSFAEFGRSGPLIREGDFVSFSYSTRNPITFMIPKLLYQDGGFLDAPCSSTYTFRNSSLNTMFSIWSTDWVHQSLNAPASSSFSFLRIQNISPTEAHSLHISPMIRRRLSAVREEALAFEENPYRFDSSFAAHSARTPMEFLLKLPLLQLVEAENLPNLRCISTAAWVDSCLSRPELKWFVPSVVAPAIALYCTDRTFLESQNHLLDGPTESLAMYGLPPHLQTLEETCDRYCTWTYGIHPRGLIATSPRDQLPKSNMQVPEAKRLVYDSAKLARLDSLLQELKHGDHRVLIYFQMTRMMDLMEEYLIYRQFKYLRLDGSSKLEDRRDMVIDWQTRPDIFVFLLSTRAGGLGINLTAADTVIFYDHDWNPSNDAQAMDRAHRLGQTRQVTVYRLITKGTIDERIVQLARVKKDVQDIVVGNKTFTDVTKPSEIVQLLLNDEQLATLNTSAANNTITNKTSGNLGNAEEPVQDLWNDEEDSFFGHSAPTAPSNSLDGDDQGTPTPMGARGKKRRAGTVGASRGRKPTGKKVSTVIHAELEGERS
ncbi:SNF2 family N-terminal domain-containing protein [Collybia nuda]|uniref:Chromatin-remodeling ATPase INO80 n=1 Tax=Collybia nuda TaxID=64659 RepID=A0A9P5XTZ0_9AGAR|nr:SNF2 family N-terminal domain-containing protein [Collybia nuda]